MRRADAWFEALRHVRRSHHRRVQGVRSACRPRRRRCVRCRRRPGMVEWTAGGSSSGNVETGAIVHVCATGCC